MLKPLPTSTSTFRDIINGGFLYIDKTQDIYNLVKEAKGAYFLSRPRRFGKSLLLSTLDELFQGHRELFQGLWIDDSDYDWISHPIIRINFSQEPTTTVEEFQETINTYLDDVAQSYGLNLPEVPYYRKFRYLIQALAETNQVVILIDEYDKPLLDTLENLSEAKKIRETLKGFYAVVKAMESHIRLVFITGVSKFSKVSIFSELNHLTDLTMRTSFATALGLTEDEIRQNFAGRIIAFAQQEGLLEEEFLEKMRRWYDGFCFAPNGENVYNPFSTMQFFDAQQFSNYWFESGSPSFLINLIKARQHDLIRFKRMQVREAAFSTYEVENLAITPLLYQTGYLTIKAYEPTRRRYTLSYPNREVEESFLLWLMSSYSYMERGISEAYLWDLIDALEADNLEEMFKILGVFFANIPYDLQVKHEKYYHTIFYLLFMMIGFRAEAEVQTNDGRIDAVVEVDERIYLFEFKLDKSAEEAMTQIQKHKYYQKYQLRGKPITYVGANFDSATRTVNDWDSEEI